MLMRLGTITAPWLGSLISAPPPVARSIGHVLDNPYVLLNETPTRLTVDTFLATFRRENGQWMIEAMMGAARTTRAQFPAAATLRWAYPPVEGPFVAPSLDQSTTIQPREVSPPHAVPE